MCSGHIVCTTRQAIRSCHCQHVEREMTPTVQEVSESGEELSGFIFITAWPTSPSRNILSTIIFCHLICALLTAVPSSRSGFDSRLATDCRKGMFCGLMLLDIATLYCWSRSAHSSCSLRNAKSYAVSPSYTSKQTKQNSWRYFLLWRRFSKNVRLCPWKKVPEKRQAWHAAQAIPVSIMQRKVQP